MNRHTIAYFISIPGVSQSFLRVPVASPFYTLKPSLVVHFIFLNCIINACPLPHLVIYIPLLFNSLMSHLGAQFPNVPRIWFGDFNIFSSLVA